MQSNHVKTYLRIHKVRLTNFRNITTGEVVFPNSKIEDFRDYKFPSILGLYGQNGSGKTSLIMALEILRDVLRGRDKLSYNEYESCIQYGCEKCNLYFEFILYNDEDTTYSVSYSFDISHEEEEEENDDGSTKIKHHLIIENEYIRYGCVDAHGTRTLNQDLIDVRAETCLRFNKPFGNKAKYSLFGGSSQEIEELYKTYKIEARLKSRSFIFYSSTFKLLMKQCNNESIKTILLAMRTFGTAYLHVINTSATGMTNMNDILPLMLWHHMHDRLSVMEIPIEMQHKSTLPEDIYQNALIALKSLNNVLCKIVPGVNLDIVDRGHITSPKGDDWHQFELLSVRGTNRIPLSYESDGVRRIVSILSLLIAVYNERSMTVAIDEIDSGIFEYLLGELLQIMGESANGQLVFTSHNLRPLEILASKYLMFTSVNPEHRFVKLTTSGNNNLRDCYFRSIVLGTEGDSVYNSTDKFEIETALLQAGQEDDYNE